MSTIITYNNLNVFSGQPTPFVGRAKENISYGERWGSVERISLVGQLTGCDFSDLTTAQNKIISGFNKDFQTLKIQEDVLVESVIVSGASDPGFNGTYIQNNNGFKKIDANVFLSYSNSFNKWMFTSGSGIFISLWYDSVTTGDASPVGLTYQVAGVPGGTPPAPSVASGGYVSVKQDVNSFENVFVNNINFPSSNYVKLLPYQIELSYYPQSSFSGFYGILDPSDEWVFDQSEDGIINITHTVSARGIQTLAGFNALENAQDFVLSRTGFSNYVAPQFIQKSIPSGVLKSQQESVNRLDSTFSLVETYTSDQFYPCDYGVLRFTVDYDRNQAGFNTAAIQGSFEGGINDDFSRIKTRAGEFDYYSSLLYGIAEGVKLNPIPLTKQFTENKNTRKIDFNLSYDDNPNYQTNLVYNVGIDSGVDLITVTVDGEVNGRGDLKNRYDRVRETYSLFNPYVVASQGFADYAGTGVFLDPNPTAESVSYDGFNGAIGFNFSYQDKTPPPNADLLEFNYTLDVTPPLRKIATTPLISKTGTQTYSKYEVTDIGFNTRGNLTIAGEAVPNRATSGSASLEAVKNAIRGEFVRFSSGYSGIYLENYSLGQNNAEGVSFTAAWSYAGEGVISGENYPFINTL